METSSMTLTVFWFECEKLRGNSNTQCEDVKHINEHLSSRVFHPDIQVTFERKFPISLPYGRDILLVDTLVPLDQHFNWAAMTHI